MASRRRTHRINPLAVGLTRLAGALGTLPERVRAGVQTHPRGSIAGTGVAVAGVFVIAMVVVISPSGNRDDADSGDRLVANQIAPESVLQAGAGKAPEGPATIEDQPLLVLDTPPLPVATDLLADEATGAELLSEEMEILDWTLVQVQSGQTMERIFRQVGLGPGLLHRVVNLDEKTRQLARIRPGDEFAFDIDDDGSFQAMRAEYDEEHWLFIEKNGEGLTTRVEPRALDRRVVEASGTITSSLFNAAKAAELSDSMTMRLASIFGWDIDFAMDIRAGDSFSLVYEEVWRDGKFLRHGPILAARFVNQDETFDAIRFDAGNGPDYYAPDGRPMRKAFLRAPLNFTRVTSNFNPRRFHPITRQVRPHNGTDYGAATGTPVWAAGDGRVIASAYNNANGNYVFIQHGNNVVTRYLHLSRRDVRSGDRVRQGQSIGTVGATGMATGPHLHYEFLVHGTHRNPRTVDLPPADPLPDSLREEFNRAGRPLLAKLDNADPSGLVLAQRDSTGGCEGANASC
ncbi:MAG: peptidoglycan DD-metalloendopeptidase family protein [Wenzhouxiangella sp.]